MTKATTKRVMFEHVSEEFNIWTMTGKGTPDTWTCNIDPEKLVPVAWYGSRWFQAPSVTDAAHPKGKGKERGGIKN